VSGAAAMMQGIGATGPVLVGTSTGSSSAATMVVNKPAGVVAGNLLVAAVASSDSNSWSIPSGWTKAAELVGVPLYDHSVTIFTKVAGGAEPASYTFDAGASLKQSGIITAWSGLSYDSVGSSDVEHRGDDIIAPSITLGHDGLLLAVYSTDINGETFTTPTGMLPLIDFHAGTTPSLTIFSQQLAAGATGSRTSTPSGGGASSGILLGLKDN
jgi:hypothetical protein